VSAAEGDPAALRALAEWRAGARPGRVLADHARRRLVRIEGPDTRPLLVKHFRVSTARHSLRERWKDRLGLGAAAREWRRLGTLHAAGVPVPEPLARVVLPDGDRLVVLRWLDAEPLLAALRAPAPLRRRRLAALGAAVARLHAAGFAHGDLHAGNVLVSGETAFLLDFQRARPVRRSAPRLRDLAWLDHSLSAWLSLPDRVRLRAAALGAARPYPAEVRARLREIGRLSARRAAEHARSRTRRSLRPGRLQARAVVDGLSGLRAHDFPEAALRAALRAHREAVAVRGARCLKADGRSALSRVEAGGFRAVVKQTPGRGPLRALADAWRGSAGRRAWRGGHGLLARGIGAARPLAFLERRALGLPLESWLVLEDLHPAEPADAAGGDPARVVDALARLALALHRCAVDHGDLKSSHVFVRDTPAGLETRLIDLSGVRFPRRLAEARRLQALAELNASLPDRFPDAARRRAFARYAAALPFAAGRKAALRAIVAESRRRHHRWSGQQCGMR
jgi:tRNA A-37 threonylcarbamoyl transferase component Bud32